MQKTAIVIACEDVLSLPNSELIDEVPRLCRWLEDHQRRTERRWTRTVTDLRKNSRYPGLARAVLFPILLLIVCKKKTNHKLFHCVPEPAFAGVFPAFHMELVKVPVVSARSLGPEHRLGKGMQPHIQQEYLLLERLHKYSAWICEKCTINKVPCSVCLASPLLTATRDTEGSEIQTWESNEGVKQTWIKISESHIKTYEDHICMSQLIQY